MKIEFVHGVILIAAAIAFFLGIEWLYLSLFILFIALVFADYSSKTASRPVPPPAPKPGQPPYTVISEPGGDTFLETYLANLISDVSRKAGEEKDEDGH